MKAIKIFIGSLFLLTAITIIALALSDMDTDFLSGVIISVICALTAFLLFRSALRPKNKTATKQGKYTEHDKPDVDTLIQDLASELASSIQIKVPELTEQQQKDVEAAKERERMSSNPKFHRTLEEEDLSFDFEEQWGDQVHFLESEMQKKYSAASQAQNYNSAIELAREAITLYQTLKSFCYKKGKDGQIYFQDTWEYLHNSTTGIFSYEDTILSRIDYWKEMMALESDALSLIKERSGSLLQKDIYQALPQYPKGSVQKTLRNLESQGRIARKKKSSTYLLFYIQ